MTLSVICAGYARTGTTSLGNALEQIGCGPCYTMGHVGIGSPWQTAQWEAALEGREVDWDRVFEGHRSVAALAGTLFYRQLAEKYPDAKVILTVRDPEAWFDSTTAMLGSSLLPALEEFPFRHLLMKVYRAAYGERFDDHDALIATFHKHNAEVKEYFSSDRLLVFDVRQGWGPLCEFLGVTVPETPFPRTWARDVWDKDLSTMRARFEKLYVSGWV
ncbi:sulfotransferase family protein [Steroidobacter flavus]|uniref:Sulfotransferase family protein n=1 Tax=Steroidobacter flavus TaxID=1842136 RepID=A0ABV8SPY0_9GAMM